MVETKYQIAGFTCPACVKLAERRLSKIEGVEKVEAKESGEVVIVAEREVRKEELAEALQDTDYKVV